MKPRRKYLRAMLSLVTLVGFILVGLGKGWIVEAVETDSGTSKASITINGGTLTFDAKPADVTFTEITLTGDIDTDLSVANSLKISDARGTGTGWQVSVKASQFTDNATHTLGYGSLSILKPNSFTPVGTNTNPPVGFSEEERIIDTAEAYVKVVIADKDKGLGDWTIGWNNLLKLKILDPSKTYSGTYTSTLTWQLDDVPTSF